jgi:Zn-dependent peptidase ImmA (M78 family)
MWRNKPTNEKETEAEFLELCHQYRKLEMWANETTDTKIPLLDNYNGDFWYPQVEEMASEAGKIMGLGDRPGESLYRVLEEVYDIKIFHLDLGTSGVAACAVSDEFGQAILLNKGCSRWRRNHDLAHELFHLLTWERFGHSEGICEPTEQEEKFATCFAGNLLLPRGPVVTEISKAADNEGNISFVALDTIARKFDVSLESLFWRMYFLFNFKEEEIRKYVDNAKEYVKTTKREDDSKPPLFPQRYRALAIKTLQNGDISLGRFAKLLKTNRKEAEKYIARKEPNYAKVPASVT